MRLFPLQLTQGLSPHPPKDSPLCPWASHGEMLLVHGPEAYTSSDLVSVDGIVLKHQGKGFRDSKRLRWKPLYLKSRGWLKNLFLQADGSVDANFAVWNSIAYEHIGNICKHVSSCLWLCISRANSISGCDHTSRMWDHKLTTLEGVWVSSRVEVLSEKATVGKYVKCRKARQNRSLMAVWWDSGSR